MKFSVLMSIYHKEKSEYFNRAMSSIWTEQIVKPNEIVLVQDGKLTNELYKAIEDWQQKLGSILKLVKLEKNVGLGEALNTGLKECTYNLVARMDTDDIALKNRFKKQLIIFDGLDIDICSSWIEEFVTDENEIDSIKKLPEKHISIVKYAKFRSPLNHPAVMFKKNVIEKVGGYKPFPFLEDYYLWARLIVSDAKFYNIQESLVKMRTGNGLVARRVGWEYFKNEVSLQKEFLSMGLINHFDFTINVTTRFILRNLPLKLGKLTYNLIRRVK